MSVSAPPSSPAAALDPGFLECLIDTIVETIPAGDTDISGAVRRHVARLALVALCPTDLFQAMLAAQVIAAHVAIMDAFRRALQPELAPAMAARLRANATSVARMMQTTLRTLRQAQAEGTEELSDEATVPQPSPPASRPGRATKPPRRAPPVPASAAPKITAMQPDATPWVYHRWEDMTMAERRAHFGYKSEGSNGHDKSPDALGQPDAGQ